MIGNSEIGAERLAELEELYKIAENSTANLDRLESESDRLRLRGTFSLLVGYLFIVGAVLLFKLVKDGALLDGVRLGYFVFPAASVFMGVFLCFMAFEFVRRRKSIGREREIEIDIQKRLFVLISEQMSRASAYDEISPVVRAMYEIRARRMWRTDEDVRRAKWRNGKTG
ncbi:hypothetical protein [Stenotrophomonas maltophilia]|uniref:hypothetical protein n=1 Tax=Stenotrophomonas maltophilia TaxID=40324 RepID=UPI0011B7BE14|nr:hypothetical protein [Stenotrophomonas maltophilia]